MTDRSNILLIEDSAADARLIVEILKEIPQRPFQVGHASDLASGIERLLDDRFDVLLLDLGLPDSYGRETLLRVRSVVPDLAIVILTGLDDEQFAFETLKLGAQDYLVKGEIEARQLARSLRYAFERKRIENSLRESHEREEMDRQHERERISMDLHDGVIQDIYAIGLLLEVAFDEAEGVNEPMLAAVQRAISDLHEVVKNIRSYIFELRPRQFDGNLGPALAELATTFHQDSQIETKVEIAPELPELDPVQGMVLYHIAHEALSNARKHARPNSVSVSLKVDNSIWKLEISDDGAGFDPDAELPEEHRGMRNMSSRAEGIGAHFSVISNPGQGTCIRVEVAADSASLASVTRLYGAA